MITYVCDACIIFYIIIIVVVVVIITIIVVVAKVFYPIWVKRRLC